jgi:hypothetical protein
MSRIVFSLLAMLAVVGCGGRDATSPASRDAQPVVRPVPSQSAAQARVIQIDFTKWITAYPAMAGNTEYGDGTFAGTILSRTAFDNGVIVQLQARYVVTDPTGAGHSFTALIQGTENLVTSKAVLNGVVTEGWMIGAQVHVTFQVITPCQLGAHNLCFQGTIRIQG